MKYILAHDLGTSGNKATLYSLEGDLIASCTSTYPTNFFNGNWAEQNPDDWWKAVCESTKKLLKTSGIAPSAIGAVALSGQMMGCTPVDKSGKPLRPSILYCDQRAVREAEQILSLIDLKSFYEITGHRVSPGYTLEKLMWIRDNEPEIYKNTHKTLCAKDYINFKLTGNFATDYSDASGTNAFDLQNFIWSSRIIDIAGVNGNMLPELKESVDIIGTVTSSAAVETGLKEGIPVAAGGGDGSCAGVGVGCIKPGTTYNYLGSSSWIALTVTTPIIDTQMRTMNWAHCVPGYLHPSGSMQTAGSSHNWLKETLCFPEVSAAAKNNSDVYKLIDDSIRKSPVGANKLIFLPYMLGERTPWWNPDARGAFIGLSLSSLREDMLRAVLEGITMNLGIIVNIFRKHVPVETITVIGGGAKSELWLQMMADVYGCPVQSLNYLEEATSMGAAVIGGVAAGLFKSFDVIDKFIRVQKTFYPITENMNYYRNLIPVFEKSYLSLIDTYKELSVLERKFD